MTINVLIMDGFIDCSYDQVISLERRFFVKIEINSKEKEVLTFMSEMNSAFENHKILTNMLLIDTEDLIKSYKTKEKSQFNREIYFNKDLLLLNKNTIHDVLKKVIISQIELSQENDWLEYCKKVYNKKKRDFNEDSANKELNRYRGSTEKLKELWEKFPSIEQFILSGDDDKYKEIPFKLDNFLKECHYFNLNDRLVKQTKNNDKKLKI